MTNVTSMYRNRQAEIEKQIKENNIIVKELELAREKIQEINIIYENRVIISNLD
jgi:hypothetical protein